MRSYTLVLRILLIIFILSIEQINAQDIHFSQFTESPLTTNPALTGTTIWIRGEMIYRSQWSAVTLPYKTIGASCDIKTKDFLGKKSVVKSRQASGNGFGFGVNVYNDRAGDGRMGTLQANAALAYQIAMDDKHMVAVGFEGGMLQRSINFDKLYWGNQYDPYSSTGYNAALSSKENLSNDHFIVPDLSAGIIYSYSRIERYMRSHDQRDFTLGAAIFHANLPKYSFMGSDERLNTRIVVHGTSTMGIAKSRVAILPSFMIEKQGPNQEIMVGTKVRYLLEEDSKVTGYIKGSSVSAGVFYRNKDAFILAGMYEIANYAIGISYDVNVSGLRSVSTGRGAFEITLRYVTLPKVF